MDSHGHYCLYHRLYHVQMYLCMGQTVSWTLLSVSLCLCHVQMYLLMYGTTWTYSLLYIYASCDTYGCREKH